MLHTAIHDFRRRGVRAALFLLFVLAGLPASPVRAQDHEELAPDRPDFTESIGSVRRGILQIEGGLLWSSHATADGGAKTFGGPLPLMRLGLASRLELRFGTDGFLAESRGAGNSSEHHAGRSDMAIGAKMRILEERHRMPALSVITGISLPTGDAGFSTGGHDPFIKIIVGKELPLGFEATANVNQRWDRGGPHCVIERGYSVSVGHKLSSTLRGFWEIYRISPIAGDERAHVVADTGFSRALGSNAEIDVAVGHTLMARTPAWFASLGFAFRTPLGLMMGHH